MKRVGILKSKEPSQLQIPILKAQWSTFRARDVLDLTRSPLATPPTTKALNVLSTLGPVANIGRLDLELNPCTQLQSPLTIKFDGSSLVNHLQMNIDFILRQAQIE